MPDARPLTVMLTVLGWAAIPAWPAGIASALLWTVRAELALLTVAGAGTSAALTLALLRAARERTARYERLMAAREERYDRLEGRLCGTLAASLRDGARMPPGLRVLRDLRDGPPPGAPAPR